MDTYEKIKGLPSREGPRPETRRPSREQPGPHQQLTQNAPVALQDTIFELGSALPGVQTGQSLVSLPGARAFFLEKGVANGPEAAFQAHTEFAHLHISEDGSLHVTLPDDLAQIVIEKGWGEYHPVQKGLLIFGPRNTEEIESVWQILRASYAFAIGQIEVR